MAGRGSPPNCAAAAGAVNPKRVYRMMREDNLLCVRRRKFVVTTDSNHGRKIYPNLAREMVLTGVDQLWLADITYIRLQDEFVYSGGDSGRLLAPGDRLGAGSHAGGCPDSGSAAHGSRTPGSPSGPGSSLRSRLAVCQHDYTDLLKDTASRSACRGKRIHGTTRPASRS